MSTSHDPQFGHPNAPSGTRGPAAIVWRDPAPGAAAAWAGPEAFASPQRDEPVAQEPPAQSLSSAWASAAPAQQQSGSAHTGNAGSGNTDDLDGSKNAEHTDKRSLADTEQPQVMSQHHPMSAANSPGSDEFAPSHDVDQERAAAPHEDGRRPDDSASSDHPGRVDESHQGDQDHRTDWRAASAGALGGAAAAGAATPGGWVQPGAAPTADEVHHDWTEQHGELPPSSEPWSAPDDQQAAHQHAESAQPDASSTPQGQEEYREVGQRAHDPYAPADQQSGSQQPAHDPYAQPHADQAQGHDPYAQSPDGQAQGHDPYAGAPYQQPQQHDPYAAPADRAGQQHDSAASSFLDKSQAPAQQDASSQHEQPWGGHSDLGQHHQPQQDAAAAEDAWSAHQHSEPDQPMATDPSAGDAIPAPPTGQENVAGSNAGAEADAASDDESLTIGRGRDNSIVLDDMLVSRKHLRISADNQGLLLEDLGSRNGTYVNGRRVETSHLQEGDRIGVGGTTFEVRDGWLVTI